MDVSFEHPSRDDIPELARSLQESFRDYLVPISINEEGLRDHIRVNDVHLDRSIMVVAPDGRVVGQSFSARREDRTWISGSGLIPSFRGKGIGMEMLRRQIVTLARWGASVVSLEVHVSNVKAKRIYQHLGFRHRRDLYSFMHMSPTVPRGLSMGHLRFEDCPVEAVLDLYRSDNPWQSMAESIVKAEGTRSFLSFMTMEGGPSPSEGLGGPGTDPMADLYETPAVPELPGVEDMEVLTSPHGPQLEGYCVYRITDKGVSVMDLYSVAHAKQLLSHLISLSEGKPVFTSNIFDSPAVMAFEALGFERTLWQHEFIKELSEQDRES